jgi:hypothetical protein
MNDFLQNDEADLRLKEHLKRAVQKEAPPYYLEARIRNAIRAGERRPAWTRRLAPVAAAVAVCLGGVIAYQLGNLRLTMNAQESYIASVSNHVATLMRVGLGDHIHCSVFRKFPKDLPPVEELAKKLEPEYQALIPIVRNQVPEDYRLAIAHECRYRGRRFVHVSLKSDRQLLSLVIARKREGESFETEKLVPALAQSGISYYRAGVQQFQLASFESRDHLVYFISDLSEQRNLEIMVALGPQVKELLRRVES